jgi:DNA end-binding protein Ku
MVTTDPDTGPIDRKDLVKGYEVSKGEYILLTDEEIKAVKLESTKTIDIERFVAGDQIDRIYWDSPYYLAPDGKLAQEAFGVIRTAMEKSGQIALARIVMATRERLLALEPRGAGILAYTIRSDAEVRKADEVFAGIAGVRADPGMIAIAEQIIAQKEGPFEPSQFVDRYEESLRALIEEKTKGHKPVPAVAPAETNVVDLMSALRASLGGASGGAKGGDPTVTTAGQPKSARTAKVSPARTKSKTRKVG